ncbi:MAG TPA: four-carbon acid sugar kinase family protein [Micromonosporaceae bacterium]|nr:four-carbon acid sugar kinase family protein [Micromonosporaceae bacterium]
MAQLSVQWRSEIAQDPRRVVVIDDDPTGTQAVSGLPVLLRPSRPALARFFAGPARAVFVLSNSRALPRAAAAGLVRQIATDAHAAAAQAGVDPPAILLRGDSTLRGHVFAETDAVDPAAPVLFVPAFIAGGRVTMGGVHYLRTAAGQTPVVDTEFARDPVFGYRARHLTDWVREVGGDRRAAVPVPHHVLHRAGPDAVADALRAATAGTVVVPDAATDADIEAITAGLVRAERRGIRVVVRCAASLAAVRTGARGRPVGTIPVCAPGRVLVVCGSYTGASTAQLAALGPLAQRRRELPAAGADPARLRGVLAADLAAHGRALLATPRGYRAEAGDALMDQLVRVVAGLAGEVDLVVAKGGITSARLARDALGADTADVVGQPEPGVVLWRLAGPTGPMPYVVVPGNVGDDGTLARLLSMVDIDTGAADTGTADTRIEDTGDARGG